MEKAAQKQAGAAIKRAVERIRAGAGESLQISTEIIRGYATDAILHEAESWGADLIVLGSPVSWVEATLVGISVTRRRLACEVLGRDGALPSGAREQVMASGGVSRG